MSVFIGCIHLARNSKAYTDYLKSPKWAAKRQMYFARYGKMCRACGRSSGPIHLHHMSYSMLGREPMADLVALCQDCHRQVEYLHRKSGRKDLRATTLSFIRNKKKR